MTVYYAIFGKKGDDWMKNQVVKSEWTTPEMIEYGSVTSITKVPVKTIGTGDSFATDNLSPWASGTYNPK